MIQSIRRLLPRAAAASERVLSAFANGEDPRVGKVVADFRKAVIHAVSTRGSRLNVPEGTSEYSMGGELNGIDASGEGFIHAPANILLRIGNGESVESLEYRVVGTDESRTETLTLNGCEIPPAALSLVDYTVNRFRRDLESAASTHVEISAGKESAANPAGASISLSFQGI